MGTHLENNSNNDVGSFYSNEKTVKYFPQELEKFFKNLRRIFVEKCQMKEIKQADLKPFSELKELFLGNNDIEVLEVGLFDFNPKLKLISFWHSKIFHINQNVFNNLKSLTHLWLIGNKCINGWAYNRSSDMQAFISNVKDKCYNLDFVKVKKNLNELENGLNQKDYNDLIEKFDKSEDIFNNSQFSHYQIFKDKFENIRNDPNYKDVLTFSILHKIKSKSSQIGQDLINLDKKLNDVEDKLTKIEPKIDQKVNYIENKLKESEARTIKVFDIKVDRIGENVMELQFGIKNIIETKLNEHLTEMNTKITQKVDEVENMLTEIESKMIKFEELFKYLESTALTTIRTFEDRLNLVKSQLDTTIHQNIDETNQKLKDIETKTIKTIDSKVNTLVSKMNSKIDAKFRDIDKNVKAFNSETLKAVENILKELENKLSSRIEAIGKKVKDSEINANIKFDQIFVKIVNQNKSQNESIFLTNQKLEENDQKCLKVADEALAKLKVVENLENFLKSTIRSISALSQKIDNFECKNEQKNVKSDEIDEIRNKLSLIEDKIDRQESMLTKFFNKYP